MPETVTLACLHCGQKNRIHADRAAGSKCGTCGAKLVTGKVTEIDAETLAATRGDGLPLVVDFWAPWCGPCRMMAPEFSKAAQAAEGKVRFAKIDTQMFPELSAKFGIRGIPLLILFQDGHEVARLAGARPAADITQFVDRSVSWA